MIYINGRFLTQSITGVQRYAIEFIKYLDRLLASGIVGDNECNVVILTPADVKNKLELRKIKLIHCGRLKGHLWEQLELPFFARSGVLINLCNVGPIVKREQFVTIHDAAVYGFPQAYSKLFRLWYKILLPFLGIQSRAIMTVSQFSKNELVKYCDIYEDKVHVVYLGREHILEVDSDDSILEKHNLSSKKFILAVSSLNPNKNFATIVKALNLLNIADYEVVIAGGTNPAVFSGDTDLPAHVKHVGYVTDGELRALYEHAACFIFPSFYEGFGLPPLEAMACGCPVIVSEAASLPEVCGDAALYCDPSNPQDIADKISEVISSLQLQVELQEKGRKRSAIFSWETCVRDTMRVILRGTGNESSHHS